MNIVFDFGGVLFRWQPHEFMARLLPEHTRTEADTQTLIADFFEGFAGDWGEFDRGALDAEPLAHRIVARTGLPLSGVQAVIATIPHELVPLHDTVALLHRLHEAGHALYYLSNMPAPYAEHLEVNHAFLALFRAGIFSARVNLIKPDPAIYEHATEVFGIAPAETLFIDDVGRNVAAARAAGWQALQFSGAAACEAELVARGLLPSAR